MRQLLDHRQNGPMRACRDGVPMIADRIAGGGGERGVFVHEVVPVL
jgi:hypothetical protein